MSIIEVHGVICGIYGRAGTQQVTVVDEVESRICLYSTSSYGAILSAAEARMLASQLLAAADRMDPPKLKPKPPKDSTSGRAAGGKARWNGVSAKERSDRMKAMAMARWLEKNKTQPPPSNND